MLHRIAIAAVFTLGLSSAAYAGCNCGPETAYSETAYSQVQDRGVTVLRGNIPNPYNARAAASQNAKAAQRRADAAAAQARSERRRAAQNAASQQQNFSHYHGEMQGRFGPRQPSSFRRGRGIQRGFGDVNGRGFGRGFSGKSAGRITFSNPSFSRGIRS